MLLTELELSTDVHTSIQQIIFLLNKWKCCGRCILRFLGEKFQIIYMKEIREIEDWINFELKDYYEKNKNISHISLSTSICTVCLGLLQDTFCSKEFMNQIAENVRDSDYDFRQFVCALYLPVATLIREHAVWQLLEEHVKSVYGGLLPETDLFPMKDAWKFINVHIMEEALEAHMRSKSEFEISIYFENFEVEKECNFLLDLFPDTFIQRKKCNEKWHVFNNTNVTNALKDIDDELFRKNYQCPPKCLKDRTVVSRIESMHSPIHIAGRYNKYTRFISQTPWLIEGVKKSELSVEEIIAAPVKKAFRYTELRFSSSGREDVDVKMLGNGRPFALEITDPHRVYLSDETLKDIQKEINDSSVDVQVRDLQIVTREDTFTLKKGELEKKKSYSASCWCKCELTEHNLKMAVTKIEGLVIKQKTPIRVLHRRSLACRERTIYSATSTIIDKHHFKLELTTQAGTYIKEFIHSDFGRTQPSMCDILGADCDILELDVTNVDLNWPKPVTTA